MHAIVVIPCNAIMIFYKIQACFSRLSLSIPIRTLANIDRAKPIMTLISVPLTNSLVQYMDAKTNINDLAHVLVYNQMHVW